MKIVVTGKPNEGKHWSGTGANGQYTIYKIVGEFTVDGAADSGQITTTKKDVYEKIMSGDMKEFEAEKVVSANGKYVDYKVKYPSASGGRSFGVGSKYEPRQKISWARYEKFVGACYGLSVQLDAKNPAALFDKILGCASIMVDISPDTPKAESANSIAMATEKDVVKSEELTDKLF